MKSLYDNQTTMQARTSEARCDTLGRRPDSRSHRNLPILKHGLDLAARQLAHLARNLGLLERRDDRIVEFVRGGESFGVRGQEGEPGRAVTDDLRKRPI